MMFDPFEQSAGFVLLEAIATALREEFSVGEMIEDQPGAQDPAEAGQVNRTFRVVALTILRSLDLAGQDVSATLSGTLNRLTRRRLAGGGLDERDAEFLLGMGPGRDDWLIYFLLTPWSEIQHLLATEGPDTGNP